jgi:hypothetical protein
MSWSSWKKDGGERVSSKNTRSGGDKTTQWLRSTGGNKSNHTHVSLTRKSNGKSSAHAAGPKKRR